MAFDVTQMKKRTKVLKTALLVENMVSTMLALLLDINLETSRTMGNKSSSIPLNIKIDLLTDIQTMTREDAKKFFDFMSVRNQFMHNMSAVSFEACIGAIDGLGARLLKLYPKEDKLTLEEKYELCFDELSGDLFFCIYGLGKKLRTKIESDVRSKMDKELVQILRRSIEDVTAVTDEYLEKENSPLKGWGSQIKKVIYARSLKLLKELDGTVPLKNYPRTIGGYKGRKITIGKNKTCYYLKYEDGVTEKCVMLDKTTDLDNLSLDQSVKLLNLR